MTYSKTNACGAREPETSQTKGNAGITTIGTTTVATAAAAIIETGHTDATTPGAANDTTISKMVKFNLKNL